MLEQYHKDLFEERKIVLGKEDSLVDLVSRHQKLYESKLSSKSRPLSVSG